MMVIQFSLRTYGTTIHTVASVIAELRDKRTREYVAALPFPISVEVPQPESVKWAREVSKRTGDFFVLSKPDLDVIALSYELEKDFDAVLDDSSDSFEDVEEAPDKPECDKTEGMHTSADKVEEDEWITADNFDEKLETGLGLGALRV
ncbi:unnamed protein product [Dibothriocephalus latus]|uniref:Ribonuclease PIN domain-containing protein n=1 Tax=Dibothriocephalus latus TaxID=60516 RepID=A0A3P7P236_DIBLA|nr:unnamed protein product [Dibothriocephalus latus]